MNVCNVPPSTLFETDLIEERRISFLDLWQVPRLWKKVSGTIAERPELSFIIGSEELWEVENG